MRDYHKPVLLDETLYLLNPKEGNVIVDATLGGGGHAEAILQNIGQTGTLIGIDRDPEAIDYAKERLKAFENQLILVNSNFGELKSVFENLAINEIDGALFDLGVSSHQLDSARGFSFLRDDELDMRMSPQEDIPSAKDIVNKYSESELADIIWRYGEERYSRSIARAIVERRSKQPIRTTKELAEIIFTCVPVKYRHGDIHPATRTFQAIRVEVNRELQAIEKALPVAIEALRTGGRICVISFESLSDRIVKNIFRRYAGQCNCPPKMPECICGARELLKIITKKPVTPSADEIESNPRSRSAKLRCAEKIYK